ncbi:MAG: orotidine-5'-phosphate decarboxylase [Myxococcota bacterium]
MLVNKPGLNGKEKFILALDVSDTTEAVQLANMTKDYVGVFKIGLQLFLKEGKQIVREVAAFGNPIFLDLKLHDIPATVHHAILSLQDLPLAFLTVHTAGGKEMLTAARKAAEQFKNPPVLLGVTVMTSIDNENAVDTGLEGKISEVVMKRVKLIEKTGIEGVVTSGLEVKELRRKFGRKLKYVIPGIRHSDDKQLDQKRTVTPALALQNGADYLVVGRPVRLAEAPGAAARKLLEEINSALN